jgi:hypothetical protein
VSPAGVATSDPAGLTDQAEEGFGLLRLRAEEELQRPPDEGALGDLPLGRKPLELAVVFFGEQDLDAIHGV